MLQLGSGEDSKGSKKITAPSGDAQSVAANRLSEMTAALKEGRGKAGQAVAKTASRSAVEVSGVEKAKKKGSTDAPESFSNLTELLLRGNKLRVLDGLQGLGAVSRRVELIVVHGLIDCLFGSLVRQGIEVLDLSMNDLLGPADAIVRNLR
jgi:hypothetical protein